MSKQEEAITIESRDDLDEAVKTLGDLKSDRERKQAAQDKAVRRAKRTHNDELKRLDERIERIERKALEYAREHRGELLEEGSKTVNLLNGDIKFRAGRKKVVFLDDKDAIIERLVDADLSYIVTFSQSLSKRAVKKHRDAVRDIKGIDFRKGEETISIDPITA
jgi:phage host-nuclease inhibitor protein Gam